MTTLNEQGLAALALTSSLVEARARPLSAQEFWDLRRVVEPSTLRGMSANEIVSEHDVDIEKAERIASLLARGAGLAIALEKLDHSGTWTITTFDENYPERLRSRLVDNAPVVLHGVGDLSLLAADGVGVVGSPEAAEEGRNVTAQIAETAVKLGYSVVSGTTRSVDQKAMNAAFKVEGQVVGVLAGSMEQMVARPGIRQGVMRGRICLVTSRAPSSHSSMDSTTGYDKIIYGLSRCTVVVASDHETGEVWAGATDALKNPQLRVISWTGPGCGTGNRSLVTLGAEELPRLELLQQLLGGATEPDKLESLAMGEQLTLGFEGPGD